MHTDLVAGLHQRVRNTNSPSGLFEILRNPGVEHDTCQGLFGCAKAVFPFWPAEAEGVTSMTSTEPLTLEQISQRMDELAREIGTLDLEDSRRPDLIDEMSRLTVLLAELCKRQRDN
jgi:hypothetical protein